MLAGPGQGRPPERTTLQPIAKAGGLGPVLLLVRSPGDPEAARREIAELEGLVRSAGSVPVGLVVQSKASGSPQTLWCEGKLPEAALEATPLGASLVGTVRVPPPPHAPTPTPALLPPVTQDSQPHPPNLFPPKIPGKSGKNSLNSGIFLNSVDLFFNLRFQRKWQLRVVQTLSFH